MAVEYLRVVFISLIVLLHILWKDYGGLYGVEGNQSIDAYVQLGLTNLVSLGVTGFILISGFYGVKLKLGRIYSLWMQTIAYALLSSLLLKALHMGGGNLVKGFINAPLALFDGWWFVSDYLILMMLSPFLNQGIAVMDKKSLGFVIVLLSFFMYGAQWFHAKDSSMPLLLFFNTYLIGRYIRLYPIKWLETSKCKIFVIGLLILISEPMMLHAFGLDSKLKFVGGNFNVLVLVVDVALLLICNDCHKLGKGNLLTQNVLAVYLIHESGFGRKLLHDNIFFDGRPFNIGFIMLVVVVVVLVCVLIEEGRKRILGPIEKKSLSKLTAILSINIDK